MRVVRITVVRASRLVAVASALLLLVTVLVIAFQMAAARAPGEVRSTDAAAAYTAALSVSVAFPPIENEHTDPSVDGFIIEILPSETPSPEGTIAPEGTLAPEGTPSPEARRVLIYHTHTHEAYRQETDDPYVALEEWRTNDERHSIVRVGACLKQALTQRGFFVVHDTTDHEPPRLATAYQRSLETLESYREEFDLYIDLHRDAYNEKLMPLEALVTPNGAMARLMVLIGNGDGFADKPDVAGNLGYANALTDCLNELYPGLCLDVRRKSGRYNQHLHTPSILIEVGHNLNTLTEAMNAMPALAEALARM